MVRIVPLVGIPTTWNGHRHQLDVLAVCAVKTAIILPKFSKMVSGHYPDGDTGDILELAISLKRFNRTMAREYLLKTEDVIKCIAQDPRLQA